MIPKHGPFWLTIKVILPKEPEQISSFVKEIGLLLQNPKTVSEALAGTLSFPWPDPMALTIESGTLDLSTLSPPTKPFSPLHRGLFSRLLKSMGRKLGMGKSER